QILRLFQAEARDRANLLDHLNLLLAARLQNDGEFRLLLGRGRGRRPATGRTTSSGPAGDRRGDGDAELLLERLDQLRQLEHRHVADGLEDVVLTHGLRRHCVLPNSVKRRRPRRVVLSAPRERPPPDRAVRSAHPGIRPSAPAARRPPARAAAAWTEARPATSPAPA